MKIDLICLLNRNCCKSTWRYLVAGGASRRRQLAALLLDRFRAGGLLNMVT